MKPHLHFMGIGGVGMSGLARWYAADGYRVSGCDAADSQELSALRDQGIEVYSAHDAKHLANDVDVLVSSMAVPSSAPEIRAAKDKGLSTLRRIELLAQLLQKRRSITVTGTHGKSTTTGMIASLLLAGEQDPSVLVGGLLPCLNSNVRYGQGELLIAEVDESDPGFALLSSDIAVITNLEDDHIAGDFAERRNYHASFAELEQATLAFAQKARQLLYCADWSGLKPLLQKMPQALTYGLSAKAAYRAEILALGASSSRFLFHSPSGKHYPVSLAVPGKHNIQNAVAALAAADLAGIEPAEAAKNLAKFNGVGRRWQRWGSINNALIIDDYAHHPTEIEVTLEAAKNTGRRVRAVLQPHRWVRTARHWPAIADAASLADEVVVLDVYSAGEQAIPGVSANLIVERIKSAGKPASHHDIASAQEYLSSSLKANDLVITLGAGDVWKVARGIVAAHGGDDGSA